MSVVTSIILITSPNDGDDGGDGYPSVDALNAWLREAKQQGQLVRVDQHAGGTKCMQCDVWMAGLNMLDNDAFIKAALAIPWAHPDCVQLMIQREQEDLFTIYTPPA